LIRLKTDKEIQAFSLGQAWLDFDGFGWIWVDLAKFGFGL
jgi:hypothetical protein